MDLLILEPEVTELISNMTCVHYIPSHFGGLVDLMQIDITTKTMTHDVHRPPWNTTGTNCGLSPLQ